MCSPARVRLGKGQSSSRGPRSFSQAERASRVVSVISKGTGHPVFCCTSVARRRSAPPGATSLTRSLMRSQPRCLALMSQSNKARSRTRAMTLSCWRMATCLASKGGLGREFGREFKASVPADADPDAGANRPGQSFALTADMTLAQTLRWRSVGICGLAVRQRGPPRARQGRWKGPRTERGR